ncbi:unnamed protein product [Bemisia tabaci]|uniref:Uncharacterized protein n=1 Tax=Bemisia tabaci TaxID=7038 RepID=A0A9N9ZZR2_BEMTA|nr:unnamed protein product [Bemisia tabaci]
MFRLLFCLLWVQLLASDEINERPKFSPKNIVEMGETRSNPMKSFDTSVARPILILTTDSIEPDANSTSDKELTTRSGRWGMSWFKNWRSAPRSPKPPKEEKRGKCRRRCKKAAKVQLLASDEINERPKFFPNNSIEVGETRSNPMKSFDTSVARAILISTEDSVEPDANSTSDEELTTRAPEDRGCLRALYMKYLKLRKRNESPERTPERESLPPMTTEYDEYGNVIDHWKTAPYIAALERNRRPLSKEEQRMESWRKTLNENEPGLSLCCCCCISRWCN